VLPPAVTNSVDWLVRNRETGEITIGQRPNAPLALFLVSFPLSGALGRHRRASKGVEALGTAGLGWWAVEELWRGVNPWRRILGVAGGGLAVKRARSLVR
jgi:hypothetical protein